MALSGPVATQEVPKPVEKSIEKPVEKSIEKPVAAAAKVTKVKEPEKPFSIDDVKPAPSAAAASDLPAIGGGGSFPPVGAGPRGFGTGLGSVGGRFGGLVVD